MQRHQMSVLSCMLQLILPAQSLLFCHSTNIFIFGGSAVLLQYLKSARQECLKGTGCTGLLSECSMKFWHLGLVQGVFVPQTICR